MAARNPIAQANIPSVKNAHVDLDLSGNGTFAVSTALESQITEVNETTKNRGRNSGRVSLRGIVLGKIPSARKVPTTSILRRNPQTLN